MTRPSDKRPSDNRPSEDLCSVGSEHTEQWATSLKPILHGSSGGVTQCPHMPAQHPWSAVIVMCLWFYLLFTAKRNVPLRAERNYSNAVIILVSNSHLASSLESHTHVYILPGLPTVKLFKAAKLEGSLSVHDSACHNEIVLEFMTSIFPFSFLQLAES